MKKLLLGLVALTIPTALAGCGKDLGACLSSHTEHRDSYMTSDMTSFDGGKTYTFLPRLVPAQDWSECDRWEFPNGRPEEPKA